MEENSEQDQQTVDAIKAMAEELNITLPDASVRRVVFIMGGSDASLLRAALSDPNIVSALQHSPPAVIQPPVRRTNWDDVTETLSKLDRLIREIPEPTCETLIDETQEQRDQKRRDKLKSLRSNHQFKQQRPAFKNQHQMRAMIRPPRRGGR